MVNQTVQVGRLTSDPESRKVGEKETTITTGTVAVNEGKDKVSFFNFEVWGQSAEFLAEHGKKGNIVGLSGRLRQDKWKDKETGLPREKVIIVADRVTLIGPKNEDAGAVPAGVGAAAAPEEDADPFNLD